MKLTFWGAAGAVTGSMHQLTVDGNNYLLDCGMYQGRRNEAREQNRHFPFPANSIDAVILSHAHIDHSGNLPLLVKNGFRGLIYATPASIDLCSAMLRDTAHIQEMDAQFLRKHGQNDVKPLYTMADAEATLPLFQPVPYHTPANLSPRLSYELYDAGHILGSSCVALQYSPGSGAIRLTFSGDVGRAGLPIVRDPDPMPAAEYLILESTYGDRLHKDEGAVIGKLEAVVNRTANRGGRIIVPAFAVGRVQQLVLLLHQLTNERRIPSIPIFVDSPLAVNVTKVFRDHPEYFNAETMKYLDNGEDPFGFKRLQYIRETEDSKKLNDLKGPLLIISPSGMCEAGRVLHHLRNNIEDPRNTVLITGFQAENTLGRRLVEGVKDVRIFGEPMRVRAEIASLRELSGHADQKELLAWMKPMAGSLKKVFLVHGEGEAPGAMVKRIRQIYGIEAIAAQRGMSVELE